MDRNSDFNNFGGFPPPYTSFDPNFDFAGIENPMFNPAMQYEQTYMYYKCLTQQLEYKIKCKEYEKLNSKHENLRQEK